MIDHSEVTDPTDWKNTSLPAFETVESCLRCQICKEFFNTPLLTSCNHSFCSLCIRRCIAANGKCPTCQKNEQQNRLRKNVALQEVTDAFIEARETALKLASESLVNEETEPQSARPSPGRPKRKRGAVEEDMSAAEGEYGETDSRRKSQRRKVDSGIPSDVMVIDDDEGDNSYDPGSGLVACPICGKRMKENLINLHLDNDRCAERPLNTSKKPIARSSPNIGTTSRANKSMSSRNLPKQPLERLPQLNYSLLNQKALSKKLAELGLPCWGVKPLLAKRHLEWLNMWNANCDSRYPRPKRELLDELQKWERTQGGLAPPAAQRSTIMTSEFNGEEWATTHKDDFKELIAKARRKKAQPTASQPEEGQQSHGQEDKNHFDLNYILNEPDVEHLTQPSSQLQGAVDPDIEQSQQLVVRPASSDNKATTKTMLGVHNDPAQDVVVGEAFT